jgi:Fe2+ or Zn2+ uptake regulation protein
MGLDYGVPHCQNPHHQHPEHADAPCPDPAARVEQAVAILRHHGMRRTRILNLVLHDLARRTRPATIAEVGESLGETVDPATLYRMMERLLHAGVVRRLGLHERAHHYELLTPGQHKDYLICTRCGAIGEINEACPVHDLQDILAKRTGYTELQHDLVFYGVCPECRGIRAPGA